MKSRSFLVVLTFLLILIVGPLFGPVAVYLVSTMDVRSATASQVLLFLVAAAIVFGVVLRWMRGAGRTLADIGWGVRSSPLALALGTFLGIIWGVFGMFGYLHFVPGANMFEVSAFRLFLALTGAGVAILEDLVTRGFVMNELSRLSAPRWLQVFASSLLFAVYHSIWAFNPIGFIFSFVYGAMLAGLFILGKRSLTPVILAHSLAFLVGEPFLSMTMMEAIKQAIG